MRSTERSARILIVDDQALFADSLRSVLGYRAEDFEVIGVATDGEAAIEFARRELPDLILMDIRMPGLDGVRATKAIHDLLPQIKIIVLTSFDDDEYIYDALDNGAVGYILKDIPVSELISSLRAVMDGAFLVSPAVAQKLMRRGGSRGAAGRDAVSRDAVSRDGSAQAAAAPEAAASASALPKLEELSKREREILALLARGLDNARIAEELFISEQTVKNYVYGIYSKLGEHNRVRVAEIARRWLGESPP
jgi:DNA-binding NarL/FixJ family response regulator